MIEISTKKQQVPHDQAMPGSLRSTMSISLKLRELYGRVEEQAIPDQFIDLLDRLEQASLNASPAAPT